MPRRSYDQYCGLARALDVVGERWTLLVIRNLLLGPRRYSDLLAELPGITTNLLAKRLAELEKAGLVEKQQRPPPFAVTVYALTADGAALEPAVHALAAWGGRWMKGPRRGDTLNLGWGLLSLKRRYRGGLMGSVRFVVDGRGYTLRFPAGDAPMTVTDVDDAAVDATVTADAAAVRGVFMTGDAVARRRLHVEGDSGLVERVLGALAPPTKPA